jgi:hypothetical protein
MESGERRPWRTVLLFVVYVVVDVLCVGFMMGVPILCIPLGFIVGWYVTRRLTAAGDNLGEILRRILKYAIVTSLVTFVMMAAIWGPCVSMLFDPKVDLRHFGIPQILYTPKASFIGWLVLMIAISPLLQLLATVSAAYLTLTRWLKAQGRAK